MFEPKYSHEEGFIWRAVGIPEEKMDIIRKFQVEYGIKSPSFDSVSSLIEYYWERIPEELKEDPFFTFYIGLFVQTLQTKSMSSSINMN